jgi:hypothetical protein
MLAIMILVRMCFRVVVMVNVVAVVMTDGARSYSRPDFAGGTICRVKSSGKSVPLHP